MGNMVNIPQESGNGWVILHVDRQCIEVTVSSDQAADPKLLAFGVQPHDFRQKMEDFSTQVNAQVKPAYYKMFGAIAFATIFANIGTRLLEFNVAMALTIAYIPLIWSIWVLIKTMKGLPEKISTVFESWKVLGITAEYYPGSKHSKPRLGFKLPTNVAQMQQCLGFPQQAQAQVHPQQVNMAGAKFDPYTGQPLTQQQQDHHGAGGGQYGQP